MALRMQQEEEAAAATAQKDAWASAEGMVKCQLCSTAAYIDDIYVLDECSHKFCRPCISKYAVKTVQTSVAIGCPVAGCQKALSVRDVKELIPKTPHEAGLVPTRGSGQSTQRLFAELKHILDTKPEKSGYSVEPIDDNMYLWEVKLFAFDPNEPITQDLKTLKKDHILLHITFPNTYPMNPPFVRVIRPRFAFRTGHVTIGGSICTELLTNKGWSPANTVEAVIMSVRSGFLEGGARLDTHNRHDYNEAEARDAYNRMVQTHGWY